MTVRSALAGALLLLAPGAFAQGTGGASPLDAKFLTRTAQGSAYELASAKLAAEKASRAEVRRYAAKLVSDHEDFNGALQQLARAKGGPVGDEASAADQKRLARLQRLSGLAFDSAYVREAIRINAEDERDFSREAKATRDGEVRQFVARFRQLDAEHDRMARELRRSQ